MTQGVDLDRLRERLTDQYGVPDTGGYEYTNPDGPEAAEAIRALTARALKAEAERDAARRALGFYADPISYALTQMREPRSAVHGDDGRLARAILTRPQGGQP